VSQGYLLGNSEAEIQRLVHLAALFGREVEWLLDDLGPLVGANAIDLGCGPVGVLPALARRVGPTGRVLGIDLAPEMVAHAVSQCEAQKLSNVKVTVGNAAATGLPSKTFDLAHVRLVLVNVAEPAAVVAEAVRLVRPGGRVVFQEVDLVSWSCEPPHPAWDPLRRLLHQLWESRGFDPHIGRRLPRLLEQAGVGNVVARAHAGIDRHDEPYGHFMVAWARRFEPELVELGLVDHGRLNELATALEAHLDQPSTIVMRPSTVQAWGRAPG
jgi:ubiquinone/menaquinone biosynthesis C-methylase UbiE